MTDEIVIEKLMEQTYKSKEEIEDILGNIDIKFIKWICKMDNVNIIQPYLMIDGIVTNFLIIKFMKALFKAGNANEN